jgi:hypothetical protein
VVAPNFFFLLDMIVVNMYIIYLAECKRRLKPPITHLQFMVELCDVLLQQWRSTRHPGPPRWQGYCYPVFIEVRKPCVVCNAPEVPLWYGQVHIAPDVTTNTCASRKVATKSTMIACTE